MHAFVEHQFPRTSLHEKEVLANLFKANDNLKVTNVAIRKFTADGERVNRSSVSRSERYRR